MAANSSLPVAGFKSQIMDTVKKHPVVVITAETGAGKSTQVPQYLMEGGYRVVVTQPRRLAARTVAERVAEEVGCKLGDLVGYRTGYERVDSANTKVLFCTDGLQLVRELTGREQNDVLVIDEVHEWNINIETLVAWTRKRLLESPDFRLVLMSATLEAEKLAAFYGPNVPIISVPGRLFPVEQQATNASDLVPTVKQLVSQGRNVLVFQPGKKEISDVIDALKGVNAEVLPLHGELDSAVQRKCFCRYDRPKVVVATNVAQTSTTIDDIDAVVDSGWERRVELIHGIEVLSLKPISQADCKQRAGRAGRTKAGVYVLCSATGLAERPEFPKAEIERVRLDQLVLRLAAVGFDATQLEFFHQPDPAVLLDAKRVLKALGALAEDGSVTKTGRLMAKLPIDVKYARMIVEAQEREVVDYVITIAAILEIGGLRDRTEDWRPLTQETESDLLAEFDIWNAALKTPGANMRDIGVFAKAFFQAKDLRNKLRDALREHGVKLSLTGSRNDILRACVAGMVDHLYRNDYGVYKNGGGLGRQLARESVVSGRQEWVVGLPKDIQIKNRRGRLQTLNLLTMVSRVDPTWLLEVAPQLGGNLRRNYRYDSSKGLVVCDLVTTFNGQEIKTEVVEGDEGPEAVSAFAQALVNESVDHPCLTANKAVRQEVEDLNRRAQSQLGTIDPGKLVSWYLTKLGSICTLAGAKELELTLTDADVSAILGVEYSERRETIRRERPDSLSLVNSSGIYADYSITYKWESWGLKGAEIRLPLDVIENLSAENLPSWDGAQVRVYVADEGYTHLYVTLPGQTLDYLRERIEISRQEQCWNAFKANGHGDYEFKIEVPFGQALPELFEPEFWDEQTAAFAFCAPVYYSSESGDEAKTVWYLRWFKTEAQAREAQQQAEAKLVEKHREEDERRNFDIRVSEAQALYEEVENLFGQIDRQRYAAYGLTSNEADPNDYRYSESLPYRLSQAKKQAYGDGYYSSSIKPTQAIEALTVLKARIEEALKRYAENAGKEAEAQEALESARTLSNTVSDAYSANVASYDDRNAVWQLLQEAEAALKGGDYVETLEKAAQVVEKAAPVVAKWQAHQRAQEVRDALITTEYGTCPVCSTAIYGSNSHYCSHEFQHALYTKGQGQRFVVRGTYTGDEAVIELVAEYNSCYSEYELRVQVNNDVVVDDPASLVTYTFWRIPSAREQELTAKIDELKRELAKIDSEPMRTGRVEVTFQQGTDPKGKPQLEASATYTGSVKNQKADGGYEYLEEAQVYFVCRPPFKWLDEEPQAGQTWIVTAGKVIALKQGRRVIVANPQVRSDSAETIQQLLMELEMELMFLQQEEQVTVQEDSVSTELVNEAQVKSDAERDDVEEDNPFAVAFRNAGLI